MKSHEMTRRYNKLQEESLYKARSRPPATLGKWESGRLALDTSQTSCEVIVQSKKSYRNPIEILMKFDEFVRYEGNSKHFEAFSLSLKML